MKKTILLLIAVTAIVALSTLMISTLMKFYLPTAVSGFSDTEQEKLRGYFVISGGTFDYIYKQGQDTIGGEIVFTDGDEAEIAAQLGFDVLGWHDFSEKIQTPRGDIWPSKKANTLYWTYYLYESENRTKVYAVSAKLGDTADFDAVFTAHS